MKLHSVPLIAAVLALAVPAVAQTPPAAPSPTPPPKAVAVGELTALPHCVWSKFLPIERTVFVAATDPLSDRAWDGATNAIGDRMLELALECAPSMRFDPRAAGEIMELGMHREAFADLIARDLQIDRVRISTAMDGAPQATKAALRRAAEQMEAGNDQVQPPSMGPIFTALGQPTFEGAPPNKTAAWISLYVMLTVQIQVVADGFKPA